MQAHDARLDHIDDECAISDVIAGLEAEPGINVRGHVARAEIPFDSKLDPILKSRIGAIFEPVNAFRRRGELLHGDAYRVADAGARAMERILVSLPPSP